MRHPRKITADEENFRLEPDCDGSLMWRGSCVHFDDPEEETGWKVSQLGLYQGTDIIVSADELMELYASIPAEGDDR